MDIECPECEGSGYVTFDVFTEDEYTDECDTCGGRGYIIE
jgi:DnaJ-class molecular chaperone